MDVLAQRHGQRIDAEIAYGARDSFLRATEEILDHGVVEEPLFVRHRLVCNGIGDQFAPGQVLVLNSRVSPLRWWTFGEAA